MRKVLKQVNNPLNVFKGVSKIATTVSDGIQGLAQDYNSFFVNNNYKELNEIYNYKLDEVFIGWKHLSEIGSNIKSAFVFLLPEFITQKNINFASIYVSGEYKNQEIFIEYGPYTGNGKGPTYCHYYYKNAGGMRFSKTTFNYWANNIVDDYIKVYNDSDMTVEELLDGVANKFFFSANNYRVYDENGNFFVAKCVEVMNAKRFKGRDGRGNHSLGLQRIPVKILDALEENEDDVTTIVGKIPVIGNVFDIFHGIGTLFDD